MRGRHKFAIWKLQKNKGVLTRKRWAWKSQTGKWREQGNKREMDIHARWMITEYIIPWQTSHFSLLQLLFWIDRLGEENHFEKLLAGLHTLLPNSYEESMQCVYFVFYLFLGIKVTWGRKLGQHGYFHLLPLDVHSPTQISVLWGTDGVGLSNNCSTLWELCCVLSTATGEWHPRTKSCPVTERTKVRDTSSAIGAIALLDYF